MSFESAYHNGEAPWDIGRPQPALVGVAEAGLIAGSVIDLGCGTGENALYLASRGLDVTGLDAAPTAIARARDKAAARGIEATFVVGDALNLAALERTFDVAIDCGLFHTFGDPERIAYVRGLGALIPPGGRYFMLCFSDRQRGTAGPRRVTEGEIRAVFADGWRVDSIVATEFAIRDSRDFGGAPLAWLASITRLPAEGVDKPGSRAVAELLIERPASRTALGAARLRAAHLIVDDAPPIFEDRLAARLFDGDAEGAIRRYTDRFRAPASIALRSDILVRSRFAEDRLADAVRRGVDQYVIVGAGLDTFAYRRPDWARGLHIIEVDHPASQADKRSRLSRAGIETPPNVTYAPADLEQDDLAEALAAAGLDLTRPAFVACLGVFIYLDEAAIDRILATAGAMPAGSEVVFTFSRPDATTAAPPAPGSAAARMDAIGEPWRTRFEPDDLAARLRSAGFGSVEFLFPDDVARLYLQGRTDGLALPSRAVLARAAV
jgi:methyltransferase (TIGR00027 family)